MKLRSILGIYTYIVLLWALYFMMFIPSPLSWYRDISVDHRYIGPIAAYSIFLLLSHGLIRVMFSNSGEVFAPQLPDDEDYQRDKRIKFLFSVVVLFCVLRLLALGQIPIFGDARARYDVETSLGGFVDYTCTLANTLCLVYALESERKSGKKTFFNIVLLLLLQAAFFRRQDIFEILAGSVCGFFFYRKVGLGKFLLLVFGAFVAAYFVLGAAAVMRAGGADAISKTTGGFALPIWVIIGDVTGATKFAYQVLDLAGSGALQFKYTLGEFASILRLSDGAHGATLLKELYTDRDTAQSISAPLSLYLDGGYYYVILAAVLTGLFWGFVSSASKYSRAFAAVAIIIFLQALWSTRSGEILLYPARLYQFFALMFIYTPRYRTRGLLQGTPIKALPFLGALGVSALFLIVRLPKVL